MLQTVRKAMKDLQGRFAAAVASQVGGPEVTYLVCGPCYAYRCEALLWRSQGLSTTTVWHHA